MSATRGGVEEQELTALVDGRLPPERAAAIDAYLAAHPEEKARLQQYDEQRQGLRDALAAPPGEAIPSRLRVARLLAAQRQRRYWRLGAVAAAVVLSGIWGDRRVDGARVGAEAALVEPKRAGGCDRTRDHRRRARGAPGVFGRG